MSKWEKVFVGVVIGVIALVILGILNDYRTARLMAAKGYTRVCVVTGKMLCQDTSLFLGTGVTVLHECDITKCTWEKKDGL